MKKILLALLTAALLVSVGGCAGTPSGGSSAPSAPAVSTPEPTAYTLQAGFGRVDITPELGGRRMPLGGYPNGHSRTSNAIQSEEDRIFATCVAIADEGGNTLLLLTLDVISINDSQAKAMRNRINEATGVPAEHIQIACTHTHSGPLVMYLGSDFMSYSKAFIMAAKDCAVAAVADLAPAKLYTGETQVENMNWVRHYKLSDGTVAGDNFGHWGQGLQIQGHTTQADSQMQLIRFERETAKDVVMVNWQAHPSMSSTSATEYGKQGHKFISSDFIGHCRSYVEQQADCLFAFYQGAAGNLNARSNIAAEQALCPEDTPTYGKQLGDYVLGALDTLTARNGGPIQTGQQVLTAASTAANAPADVALELNAVSAGPVAFVTTPCEMFDTNGMYVKENSPFETTFVLELANGYHNYLPSADVFDYDPTAYEASMSQVVKGTGETAAQTLVDLLRQQHDAAK